MVISHYETTHYEENTTVPFSPNLNRLINLNLPQSFLRPSKTGLNDVTDVGYETRASNGADTFPHETKSCPMMKKRTLVRRKKEFRAIQHIRSSFNKLMEKCLQTIDPHLLETLPRARSQLLAKVHRGGFVYVLMQISSPEKLTAREQEIALLAGEGLPNKAIAERLRISPATVAAHLRRIFEKLEIDNRTALARQSMLLS